MIRSTILVSSFLAALSLAPLGNHLVADESLLAGYSADSSRNERQWEDKFRAMPSPANLRSYMEHLTAHPHHVGSPYDKANAEWIKAQPPYLIRLMGFADTRGSIKKNERLAERRARAVRDAYVNLGIPKERLSILTRGPEEPACQPVTEDCLAKSRRTETWNS